MTFVDHGIDGSLLFSIPALVARARVKVLAYVIAAGFVWGATPDIAGYVVGIASPNDPRVEKFDLIFGIEAPVRVDVYTYFHHDPTMQWVFFLHALHDKPFHTPDGNWWPRDWPRAALHWAAEIAGILGLAYYIKQKKRGEI